MRVPWMNSIANRIQWAYIILFVLVLLGLFMQWIDLSRLRWQLKLSKATGDFADSVREVRRYEKNWFLYRNLEDLDSTGKTIEHIFSILKQHGQQYKEVSSAKLLNQFKVEMTTYRKLFQILSASQDRHNLQVQERIRKSGHELINLIQTFQKEEQANLTRKIDEMTLNGLISGVLVFFVAFSMGQKLASSVVKPLKEIVDYTKQISLEKYEEGWKESNLEEIHSVIQSLNNMVKKIKERERQIVQNTKMATLGTLVAGIAHELNNPLSNISTSAEILEEEVKVQKAEDFEILHQMTHQIIDQTQRAKRIVRSLLEFSREKEIILEKISVHDLLYEVKNLIQGRIGTKIDFHLEIIHDGIFKADRQRIGQVLINLVLNAIHAVGETGEIYLRGNFDTIHKQVYLEVEDSGAGISKENLYKIFDPFFTTKDIGEGSGLGLAVSREIIQKHGGFIHVQSQPGQGSLFTIMLPGEGL